ncbi:Uncharacterized protein YP598_3037 [Yersinia pseudotuberculosis]|uniref:Uncharacterized protein n=2 Tax=Yersinia pseudotuberculosis TaxID=633 RepID=A0A0U1R2V2_YERP3|nr:hypothetical protein YpsIP31758_2975 [Yersinia pseudotuberculosis IP 31758]UFA62652.1 Uncharacterized protein YP598_3037 [Yersinia pseudotuberculosis]
MPVSTNPPLSCLFIRRWLQKMGLVLENVVTVIAKLTHFIKKMLTSAQKM